jgi:hypothetical protein
MNHIDHVKITLGIPVMCRPDKGHGRQDLQTRNHGPALQSFSEKKTRRALAACGSSCWVKVDGLTRKEAKG